jgi:hypothetical protein
MKLLISTILAGIIHLIALMAPGTAVGFEASYLYSLSNFNGIIPFNWPKLYVDREHNEIYTITGSGVTVFTGTGMEFYQFDFDPEMGGVTDATVDSDGNILFLGVKDQHPRIVVCNYRGEFVSIMEVTDLPPDYADFLPSRMVYRGGDFYLASPNEMRVAVIDGNGSFQRGYDIGTLLSFNETRVAETGIEGFNVGSEGEMLFTVPAMGKAFRMSGDGAVREFGKRGSAPGRFGVPAGIAADNYGNYLVSDRLRCVVLAFDRNFNFLAEFGYRGLKPGNLVVPNDLAVDSLNRVYIGQLRRKGVSVFQLRNE